MIPRSHKLIRHAYEKSGMTYREISDQMGIDTKTFERWMNGSSSASFNGTVDIIETMGFDFLEILSEVESGLK